MWCSRIFCEIFYIKSLFTCFGRWHSWVLTIYLIWADTTCYFFERAWGVCIDLNLKYYCKNWILRWSVFPIAWIFYILCVCSHGDWFRTKIVISIDGDESSRVTYELGVNTSAENLSQKMESFLPDYIINVTCLLENIWHYIDI